MEFISKYNKFGRCLNWYFYIYIILWERDRFLVFLYFFLGILVVKKKFFKNKILDNCGGGIVFYVRDLLLYCVCNEVIYNKLNI